MLKRVATGSLLTGLGIAALSVLEYAYLILAGNLLPPDEFGRLNMAIALFLILLALVTVGLGTSVAKFLAEQDTPDDKRLVLLAGLGVQLLTAGGVSVALLIGANLIRSTYLADLGSLLTMLAAIFPVLAVAGFLPFAFLGSEQFIRYNFATISNVAVRVLSLAPLVALATTAEGALLSFLVGSVVAIAYAAFALRHLFAPLRLRRQAILELARFAVPVSLSTLFVTLFLRADVLLLRLLVFRDTNLIAGEYSAPAALARGLFYLSSAIALALLPVVARSGRLPRRGVIKLFLLVGGALTFAIIGAVYLHGPVMALLFPAELRGMGSLLPQLMVAMALLSLAHMLATALVAAGRPEAGAVAFASGFFSFVGLAVLLVPESGTVRWLFGGGMGMGARGVVIALITGSGIALAVSLLKIARYPTSPTPKNLTETAAPLIGSEA